MRKFNDPALAMTNQPVDIGDGDKAPLAMSFAFLAVIAGVGMDVFGKLATDAAGEWQIVLLRWGYAVAIMTMLLPMLGARQLFRGGAKAHMIRAVLNIGASFALYYALARLPLSVVLSIFFLELVFATAFAGPLLGEKVPPRRWLGVAAAFAGVLVMTEPWNDASGIAIVPALMALAGAAAWGLLHVATKKYGGGNSTFSLMFWLGTTSAVMATPGAMLDWRLIGLDTHAALFGVAVCGSLYSVFWIKGLKIAPASLMASIGFLTVPMAFLAGYVFFGEVPTPAIIAGAAIVVAAVWLATSKARRRQGPAVS